MRGFLKAVAKRAPIPIVELAEAAFHLLPPSIRYGRPYTDSCSLLRQSETWDEEALVQYQEKLLQRLARQAYDNVPYYREIFRERGLRPSDIRTVDDLSKLPFLDRTTVRKRARELVASNISLLGRESTQTSGSGGTPLTLYYDKTMKGMERAMALRHLLWIGYQKGDTVAYFKGLPLSNPRRTCKYFPGAKELRVSFHRADAARLEEIVGALEHFGPSFIDAWPSCLYIISRWMARKGRSVPPPKAIRASSENLHPHVREQIETVFKAPVVDWYGQEEAVAVAMQCAHAQGYHIQMELGIVELIPSQQEGVWEIIGTCLHNLAMPFIRYKTGDLAVRDERPCPCGRKHPSLTRIAGREADFVLTPEGHVISPLTLHFSFYDLTEIKEGQIIQEEIDQLRIKLVAWERISQETHVRLVHELRSRLDSPRMRFAVEVVEDIPQTSGGKRPFVVSRLPMEDRV